MTIQDKLNAGLITREDAINQIMNTFNDKYVVMGTHTRPRQDNEK